MKTNQPCRSDLIIMTAVVRGAAIQGKIRVEGRCGPYWEAKERGVPAQASWAAAATAASCPTDLIYAACSTSAAGWRKEGRRVVLGGRALRKTGGGGGSGSPRDCGGPRSAPWTATSGDCVGARHLSAPRIAVRPQRRIYLRQRRLARASFR